jgi:drug/metabolite transporter (DMT)-like permease
MRADQGRRAIGLALAAGLLFGLSTPAAKTLLTLANPWMLAGLLYLGSGIGLGCYRLAFALVGRGSREAALRWSDWPWLAGAIVAGGVVGPVLLMFGLAGGLASEAALLLNLESVLTAALAWVVFREHFHARIATGMALITAGALLLAWPGAGLRFDSGALLVIGACLAWAVDNNLTRRVSGGDPVLIAALKGAVAGAVNLTIASVTGAEFPARAAAILGSLLVGLLGYGLSLVLFVRALRNLGAARTGAYFAIAPFAGAIAAVVALGEPFTIQLAAGGALMLAGVWLHVTERHEHEHVHEQLEHDHLHRHDEHHQHAHAPGVSPAEPHSHPHVHGPLRHRHPHYPDLHHRHGH